MLNRRQGKSSTSLFAWYRYRNVSRENTLPWWSTWYVPLCVFVCVCGILHFTRTVYFCQRPQKITYLQEGPGGGINGKSIVCEALANGDGMCCCASCHPWYGDQVEHRRRAPAKGDVHLSVMISLVWVDNEMALHALCEVIVALFILIQGTHAPNTHHTHTTHTHIRVHTKIYRRHQMCHITQTCAFSFNAHAYVLLKSTNTKFRSLTLVVGLNKTGFKRFGIKTQPNPWMISLCGLGWAGFTG